MKPLILYLIIPLALIIVLSCSGCSGERYGVVRSINPDKWSNVAVCIQDDRTGELYIVNVSSAIASALNPGNTVKSHGSTIYKLD